MYKKHYTTPPGFAFVSTLRDEGPRKSDSLADATKEQGEGTANTWNRDL